MQRDPSASFNTDDQRGFGAGSRRTQFETQLLQPWASDASLVPYRAVLHVQYVVVQSVSL